MATRVLDLRVKYIFQTIAINLEKLDIDECNLFPGQVLFGQDATANLVRQKYRTSMIGERKE